MDEGVSLNVLDYNDELRWALPADAARDDVYNGQRLLVDDLGNWRMVIGVRFLCSGNRRANVP